MFWKSTHIPSEIGLTPQNPLRRLPGSLQFSTTQLRLLLAGVMPGTEQTTRGDLTTRTLLELLVAYTLILITVWTSGRTQRVLFYASGGWILLNSYFPDPLFGDLAE